MNIVQTQTRQSTNTKHDIVQKQNTT